MKLSAHEVFVLKKDKGPQGQVFDKFVKINVFKLWYNCVEAFLKLNDS